MEIERERKKIVRGRGERTLVGRTEHALFKQQGSNQSQEYSLGTKKHKCPVEEIFPPK